MKKSCIRETKHISNDVDSSTDTKKILLVRKNSPKQIKKKFAWRFYTLYEQKFSNVRPLFSFTFHKGFRKYKIFAHWTLGSGGKKTFKQSEQMKKNLKKTCYRRGDFTPFLSKSFQIWDLFFSLLFPKDSESLRILDIRLQEVGAKRPLNWVRNTDTKKSCSVWQNLPKNNFFCAAILHPLLLKVVKSETTSFHYFTPRIPNL